VEAEIEERLAATDEKKPAASVAAPTAGGAPGAPKPAAPKKNFLDSWLEKKAELSKQAKAEAHEVIEEKKAMPKAPAPAPVKAPVVNERSESVAKADQVAAAVEKKANMPEPPLKVAKKHDAADEIIENAGGSVWAAAAEKNAEEASSEEVAQVAPVKKVDDLASGVKIRHERKAAPAPAPVASAAPEPQAKQEEDGAVLRWR
jgi:hypothetical protein